MIQLPPKATRNDTRFPYTTLLRSGKNQCVACMTREVQQQRLGELFIFKNGRAFKKEEWATTGLPIIRIQNLNSKDAPFNHFAGEYSSDIFVEPGDLLFSWSGTVGSSFGSHLWDRQPGVLNQHIFKIGFKEQIDSR